MQALRRSSTRRQSGTKSGRDDTEMVHGAGQKGSWGINCKDTTYGVVEFTARTSWAL